MYIKALRYNMISKYNNTFKYEIGKKYTINDINSSTLNNKSITDYFYFFDNLDKILTYYKVNSRFFEVLPEGNIIIKSDKCYCSEITLIREIFPDELIILDNTGKYTLFYTVENKNSNNINIQELENAVINKDEIGEYCYKFALYIENANTIKLENAVIEKDITGRWCYYFAQHIKDANTQLLQDKIIEKDTTGEWCYRFALNVKDADINKLENAVMKKDIDDNEWRYFFLRDISFSPKK
jgi:hypothetical protein